MDKKYELVKEDSIEFNGRTLYRIRALKDFTNKQCTGSINEIKVGDLGGYVQSEENLSQNGQCWIFDNAAVYDNGMICDNAIICDNAKIHNNVKIGGDVEIYRNAEIDDNVKIYGNGAIGKNVKIGGDVLICGDTRIVNADIRGRIIIADNSIICNNAIIHDVHDYLYLPGFGILDLTFYKCKDGIWVSSNYYDDYVDDFFTGSIEEFIEKIKCKHYFVEEYLRRIEFAKAYFN